MDKAKQCSKQYVKKMVSKGVKEVKAWDVKQDAKLLKKDKNKFSKKK